MSLIIISRDLERELGPLNGIHQSIRLQFGLTTGLVISLVPFVDA